jgi:hypothetical protein
LWTFTYGPSGWHQVGDKLVASDTDGQRAVFGSSVAISGGTLVVGAPWAQNQGRAYVFTRSPAGWRQIAELVGSDSNAGDDFGGSVAISGSTIAVGARGHYNNSNQTGEVYVFRQGATGWQQAAELLGSDVRDRSGFGASVAITGGMIAAGASATSGGQPGRVYVFQR